MAAKEKTRHYIMAAKGKTRVYGRGTFFNE